MYRATLPHGALRAGERYQDVLLRPPTGADELVLVERLAAASAAERVTTLLARCVEQIGDQPGGLEAVRELTVGDREALLLSLRQAAFGERLLISVRCTDCDELMDIELSVRDLLVAPYDDVADRHELPLAAGGQLRFRLPTGADQEAAAAAATALDGARVLKERCAVGPAQAGELADVETLGAEMARLDPQAEVQLGAICPACGAPVEALLDAATVLLDELTPDADALFREVHALARHYHWSQAEILGLELPRRRRYLALLVEDEDGAGGAL